jgi:glycosidase
MPELNFDNPEVRQAVLDIAKYYLDLGVDGFRFDAVKYIYYGNTARSVDFWEWYMEELRKIKPDIYCVGECWSGETEILDYYSAMNCFDFAMSQAEGVAARTAKGAKVLNFTNYVASFQQKILTRNPEGMPMSFLSNHDMDRIAGTFVTDNMMRMAANLYLLSPGSPVIYYGEEIGMRGSRGGESTDANRRLAMLWGDGDPVKNPEGTTYAASKQIQTTVADQVKDENSLYHYYCRLLAIRRRHPEIARGIYTSVNCNDKNLGGFLVTYEGGNLGIFHNTSQEELSIDLATCKALEGVTFAQLCEVIGMGSAKLEGTVLTIGPQTSVILK